MKTWGKYRKNTMIQVKEALETSKIFKKNTRFWVVKSFCSPQLFGNKNDLPSISQFFFLLGSILCLKRHPKRCVWRVTIGPKRCCNFALKAQRSRCKHGSWRLWPFVFFFFERPKAGVLFFFFWLFFCVRVEAGCFFLGFH